MKKHPAVKEAWQCPICNRTFVSNRASGAHMRIHNNDKRQKETESMFTVDVVALITRITKIEEVQQSVFDQIPSVKDGNLVIEASENMEAVFVELKPLGMVAKAEG